MKLILAFLGLLALAHGQSQEEKDLLVQSREVITKLLNSGVTPKALDDNIKQIIEGVLSGICPEEPCFWETKDVDMDLMNETIVMKGLLNDVYLRGLSVHELEVSMTLIPIVFEMTMKFPTVQADGVYDLDGNIAEIVPIFGQGGFLFNVTEVVAYVRIELTSRNLSLVVKKMDFDLELGSLYTVLENFLGGIGDVLGPILNDNLIDYLRRILYYYKGDIITFVTTETNKFLAGKSINDLIDIINGVGGKTVVAPNSSGPSIVYTYLGQQPAK